MPHDKLNVEQFLRELRGETPLGKWRPPLDPAKKLDLLVKSKQLGEAAQSLLDELRAMRVKRNVKL